jgi:hypothetical protein
MNWKVKYVDQSANIAAAFRRAAYRSMQRLGFLVRATAQASIEDESGPSEPGQPPHTHKMVLTKKGKPGRKGVLQKAILYGAEKESMSVVVGPSKDLFGTVGAAFEHEGTVKFRGRQYPPRPFMGPALGEEIGELPGILAENFGKV